MSRGEALGDAHGEALGEGLGDALGETLGDPFGDFDLFFLLSFDFALLESNCFAKSSALIKISLSLSGESGTTLAAAASLLVRSCVDVKGLKLMSR